MARTLPVGPIVERLKADEGLRLAIYYDTEGVPTIGYGRNLEVGLTEAEAEGLLANDVAAAIKDARAVVGRFDHLDRPRQEALVNMAFNLGRSRLRRFRRMLAAIDLGDWSVAAAEALDSRWARQTKGRARRIAYVLRHGRWADKEEP